MKTKFLIPIGIVNAAIWVWLLTTSMQGRIEENTDHYKTIEHQGVEGFNQECRKMYKDGFMPHSEIHVYMNGKFAVYYQQWRKP